VAAKRGDGEGTLQLGMKWGEHSPGRVTAGRLTISSLPAWEWKRGKLGVYRVSSQFPPSDHFDELLTAAVADADAEDEDACSLPPSHPPYTAADTSEAGSSAQPGVSPPICVAAAPRARESR
jgi:hypothetical protein